MKITIVGTGYVGMSMCALLAAHHDVIALDVDETRVDLVNAGKSTVADSAIEAALAAGGFSLVATTDSFKAYSQADFVIVATPTNYDDEQNYFDTSSVEDVVTAAISINSKATIVIKSTVPVGFTRKLRQRQVYEDIIFSPEFLREGSALYDNYYPSRIVVGQHSQRAETFAYLLKQACKKPDVDVLFTGSDEAEAMKLFANNYLAMRVAFFNELDTYAHSTGLNTKEIIDGISLDPRIGKDYNNPSFGYGGYCLPKDTKQLTVNLSETNCLLIPAIVDANDRRKQHIVNSIIDTGAKCVGIYKLAMKSGSDNHRSSAVLDIIDRLLALGIHVLVYDSSIVELTERRCDLIEDIHEFTDRSELILANRVDDDIEFAVNKVFSRDIYHNN